MRIAQPSNILAYLPLYIAIEGTEHEIVNYGTARQAILATKKREADLAIGDPFMFNYVDYKNEEIVIVAGFIKKIVHSLITFNPFIKGVSKNDLHGKTIVSYPEPSTSYFLARRMKKEFRLGVIIQSPFNTELGPLLTQEADIGVVLEPNISYALKNGARELVDFSEEQATTTGFCTTKFFVKENKKEIEDFFKLLKTGLDKFENNPEITTKIAKKYFPLVDEGILRYAIERLRKKRVFCGDFKFTEEEIKKGLELREIKLSLKEAKKFLNYYCK